MDTLDITHTSPLIVADRLISLAQAADRAGHVQSAEQLLTAAFEVLDAAADELLSNVFYQRAADDDALTGRLTTQDSQSEIGVAYLLG